MTGVYGGYLTRGEIISLLNRLLESERAVATVTAMAAENAAAPEARAVLDDVKMDQIRFREMLMARIERLGAAPSERTGGLRDGIAALDEAAARLSRLADEHARIAGELREAAPRIEDNMLHAELTEMREVHEQTAGDCAALAAIERAQSESALA